MVKLRLTPVALTVAVSAAVLFGGWFGYQQFFVKQPLDAKVKSVSGVKDAGVRIDRKGVRIAVELEHEADLREVYTQLRRIGQSAAGSRSVRIEIVQNAPERLEQLWAKALFDVAEAMELRRYGDIPVRLGELAAELEGVTVTAEMDEMNVYIRLSDGTGSKYAVLPRTPAVMEAWSDDTAV